MKTGRTHSTTDAGLLDERVREAARWIGAASKAIVFTGAGVSTESGIPDFRSAEGLWSRYNPAEYATLSAFRSDPHKVWHMLAELEALLDARPNAGHVALARMESGGALAGIVTQNVDGLHQAAGSRTVIEFHGSHGTYRCLTCREQFAGTLVRKMPRSRRSPMPLPPQCAHGRGLDSAKAEDEPPCVIKPDVVFFDELIPESAQLETWRLVQGADLVLVAGTSCEVYPASDIPMHVRRQGGRIIEINLEPAPDLRADLVLQGSFAATMTAVCDAWQALRA